MAGSQHSSNIDPKTVEGFGEEWNVFTQEELDPAEHRRLFDAYFSLFPFNELRSGAEGFDLGCGTGRWAALVAERVGQLHCIEPSIKALAVARRRLAAMPNVAFHENGVSDIPLADNSQDFGYSLGVLHHIPDTKAAIQSCVDKLKPGAPLLIYIYYFFDNRPAWFRALWKLTDMARRVIAPLPFVLRRLVTGAIAATVYLPLARTARIVDWIGADVSAFPLSSYRDLSFYTMRTDALDRFGTRLEQRFSRQDIDAMMRACGMQNVQFREDVPYWVAIGWKQGRSLP